MYGSPSGQFPDRDAETSGLLQALVGDGRPLLFLTPLALLLSGLFAIYLSITGQLLPHDVAYLGMTRKDFCAPNACLCRVAHFMAHDRVAFGGALIAVASPYFWLAAFPLRQGEAWAWWLFALSGTVGFGSFLTFLGYGYLDVWHGVATLALLPTFVLGLAVTWRRLPKPASWRSLLRPAEPLAWGTTGGRGRILLLATAACLFLGGLIVMVVGMTVVFVPQDLEYMQVTRQQLDAVTRG
jgi:hypothetical protein